MTTTTIDPDNWGRCAEHADVHERNGECRRFMTLAFARDLGIDDPENLPGRVEYRP